jgi:hypothetical protein
MRRSRLGLIACLAFLAISLPLNQWLIENVVSHWGQKFFSDSSNLSSMMDSVAHGIDGLGNPTQARRQLVFRAALALSFIVWIELALFLAILGALRGLRAVLWGGVTALWPWRSAH